MKIYTIYKITNIVNNKVYIGFSQNPWIRWRQHVNMNRPSTNQKLRRAMIKYGVESFQLEELCCSKDREYALKTIEPLLIAQYQATDDRYGYNMTYGGEGNPGTPEVRDKISKALTGKRASVETCKRISDSHKGQIAWNKGKLASSETKQKQSKKKQRSYQITFDNGNTITIIGLKMFCMDHGYDRGSLFRLRQGKQKSHKGIIKIESL